MKWFARFGGGLVLLIVSFVVTQQVQAQEAAPVWVEIRHGEEVVVHELAFVPWDGCTVTRQDGSEYVAEGPKAVCALQYLQDEDVLEYGVGYFDGFGLFLSQIDGAYGDAENFWLYYVNLESPATGISHTDVRTGDSLIFVRGGAQPPMRFDISNRQVVAGESVTAIADAHQYDVASGTSAFRGVGSADLELEHESGLRMTVTADDAGRFTFSLPLAGEYTVVADSDGFLAADPLRIRAYPVLSPRKNIKKKRRNKMTKKAWKSVKASIDKNNLVSGSISMTEWSAIGAKAAGVKNPRRLKKAVRAYTPTANHGTSSVARHILALEAIGNDANWVQGVNYVDVLKQTRVNNQYGDEALCNDDIFAALAMISADEPYRTEAMKQAIAHTLNCVQEEGSVTYSVSAASGDVDTTAAWLMLAGKLKGKEGKHGFDLTAERTAALNFLVNAQNPDGGWGWAVGQPSNSSSTAWALLALRAQGVKANAYKSNHRDGFHFLSSVAKDDGSIAYRLGDSTGFNQINTAYTMMALNKAPLPINKSNVTPSVFNSSSKKAKK